MIRKISSKIQLAQVSSWLIPRVCIGCGFSSDNSWVDLCECCHLLLPWRKSGCYQCGLELVPDTESIICATCHDSPPPFQRLCALFDYKAPLRKLIGGLKFGQQLYPGVVLGTLLANAVIEKWYVQESLPQLIIPVPLHIKRHRKRGYNQATEICKPISSNLGIPLGLNICERIKHTTAQTTLDRAQRIRNLSTAFTATIDKDYKHVALIDDVVTTGSTIRAVSKALTDAGVEKVDVWCVCRA